MEHININRFLKMTIPIKIKARKTVNSRVEEGLIRSFSFNKREFFSIKSGFANIVTIGIIAPIPSTSRKLPITFRNEKIRRRYFSCEVKS